MKSIKKMSAMGVLSLCIAAAAVFPAFADSEKKLTKNTLAEQDVFPFEINIETDSSEDAYCYSGSGKEFKKGICVTPEAEFTIEQIKPEANIENLKIDVVVIYDDDKTKSTLREAVTGWDYGQLSTDTYYELFPDDVAGTLEENDRLYSGYDQSVMMELTYKTEDKRTEKLYFYIAAE